MAIWFKKDIKIEDFSHQFLFDKGVVASHLVTKKKSLEKQFLEILSGS